MMSERVTDYPVDMPGGLTVRSAKLSIRKLNKRPGDRREFHQHCHLRG
jgi:hypothetical protein